MKVSKKDLDEIRRLISNVPEIYQSIFVDDNLIAQGCRDNDKERLYAIQNYFQDKQVVCDIGSNAGFFVIELAKRYRNSIFISIESNKDYSALQAKLIEVNNLANIILINGSISLDWLYRAKNSCIYFDICLMLSVVHHMPFPKEFIEGISNISREIILELASSEEKNVCGKDKSKLVNEKDVLALKNEGFELAYKSSIHTDKTKKRKFFYCKDDTHRRKVFYPYIDYIDSHPKGWQENNKSYLIISDAMGASLTKFPQGSITKLIPGINISDVSKLGKIYFPYPHLAKKQFLSCISRLERKNNLYDVKPWNIIFSNIGLLLIDYTDNSNLNLKFKPLFDKFIIINFIYKNFKKPTNAFIRSKLKKFKKLIIKRFKNILF